MNFIPFYKRIWTDPKFKVLSTEAKLLFIYLFAHDDVTLTGIYEIDIDVCKMRIGLNNNFTKAFTDVINSKMIEWDSEHSVIWVINRFKLLPTKSPKVIVGAIEELNQINHPFKQKFLDKYKEVLQSYMVKLEGYQVKDDDLLSPSQIVSLSKIYSSKHAIKNFLMHRNISEQRIDSVLATVLPNLR